MSAFWLGAQTLGSLACNALWGGIGDRYGKLMLLQAVALLRLAVPLVALVILAVASNLVPGITLAAFAALFFLVGALINGMTIGYLGYLMEVFTQRPAPRLLGLFQCTRLTCRLAAAAGRGHRRDIFPEYCLCRRLVRRRVTDRVL